MYVAENNEKAEFVENSSYVVEDAQIAFVETIAANSSVKLYAQYVVDTTDSGVIINEAEILGAIANNDYVFDTSKTYKDTADFNLMGKLKVCKYISMSQEHSKFQFNITNSDTGFESWLMLDANQCMNTYLLPGTYSVKEIIPQEYLLDNINGVITTNGGSFEAKAGEVYEINYTNKLLLMPYYHSFGRIVNRIGQGG